MISDAALLSLADSGVSAGQIVAAIIADREAARTRRAARSGAATPAKMNNPDSASGLVPQSPGSEVRPESEFGAATASGGSAKSVARAALLMMPGLRPAARAVGARLIECFNLGTGRCDPSTEKLAGYTGLSERSVRRGVAELVAARLFSRHLHGFGRRNSYTPNWPLLGAGARAAENGAIVAKADSATKADSAGRQPGQESPPKPEKETLSDLVRVAPARAQPKRHRAADPRQRNLILPIVGGAEPGDKVDRQVFRDVMAWARGAGARQNLLLGAVLELPPEVHAASREANRKRPGDGLRLIIDRLRSGTVLPAETGPPPAARTVEVSEGLRKAMGR